MRFGSAEPAACRPLAESPCARRQPGHTFRVTWRPTRRRFAASVAGVAAGLIVGPAAAGTCRRSPKASAGPFWKRGAPARTRLTAPGGRPLLVAGQLVAAGTCTPLAGALVDVWQADPQGRYDQEGFGLRAQFRTDGEGRFELRTVWPGRYQAAGDRLRPAHIHLFVRAAGHRPLTTQLYFEGDPHLAGDSLVDERLVGPVKRRRGVDAARYRLAL